MQTVDLAPGQCYTLKKHENYTTGYSWQIMASEGLRVTKRDYILESERDGAGGEQTWDICTDKEGLYYISMIYTRSGDDFDKPHIIRFKVVQPKYEIVINDDRVVGYIKNGKYYGNQPGKNPIILDVLLPKDLSRPIEFYFWLDDIVYLHHPSGFDMLASVYSLDGESLGASSGGLTGKGTGMKFTNKLFLGSIKID